MKEFFRLSLLVLILLAVALVSALTSMRIAIHGREVVVPKLVGLTPAQAEKLALEKGLLVDLENRFYSSDIPQGRVMSQLPAAGVTVRRGWRVRLAESLGPQQVSIPDVVGESSRAAEINVRRRGLDLGTIAVAQIADQPEDQVLAQSPPANAVGVANPKINLLMAAPPDPPAYVMPSYVGRQLSDAERALQAAGLKVGSVRPQSAPAAAPASTPAEPGASGSAVAPVAPTGPEFVVRQSPAAGQKVLAGASVDLVVASQ